MTIIIEKRKCAICDKEFGKPETCSKRSWAERYKFCSRSCGLRSHSSWNKGKKMWWKPARNKGKVAWNKGLPSPFVGELNNKWKGDEVSYSGIHHWVAKWKGKPCRCEKCGRTDLEKHNYHWANRDHKYRRVLDDYIRLCVHCHADYDKEHKLK